MLELHLSLENADVIGWGIDLKLITIIRSDLGLMDTLVSAII
jgi:hypothetical protein